MNSITLSKKQLENLVENTVQKTVRETIAEILVSKKSLSVLMEAVEDYGLGKLMEQGRTRQLVDKDEFMRKLNKKISARS